MFRSWLLAGALALAAAAAPAVAAAAVAPDVAPAASGFSISGGKLLDANGNAFVLRGVNHPHAWYTNRTQQALPDIKALGANSVRVVLSSGDQWTRTEAAEVSTIISQCRANRLICVLEVHDTTGYGEQSAAVSLARAVDYWLSIKSAVVGQEAYVIVNIGNEPYGNTNATGWIADTTGAIQRLRSNGFTHTLMVDAPNWGQDWSFTMRDNAAAVFQADSLRNTLFSVHMYGVFDTAAEVSAYLNRFVSAGLPIAVGEFGDNHSDGNPDEDAIMATTQSLGLGYLGWSWSGNGGGVEYLDMTTNFNAASLTSWGQRFFNGANGIKATSREASVFGGGGGDTVAPSTPGTPTAPDVTASSVRLAWTPATDNVGVSRYEVVRVSGSSESSLATATTNSATVTGLTASTVYTLAVYAYDAAGNRSTRSGTVAVTTSSGGGGSGACAVTYRVTGQWQGGFQGDVTIRNTGSSAVNGWTLRWSFANSQVIGNMWNAVPTQTGAQVDARNAAWNPGIAVNGTAAFGFTATVGSTNSSPTSFTLNGASCTVL
ncbi:MAG: cellulase family glycosylhydrolase [Kibdelosporangium sp.]